MELKDYISEFKKIVDQIYGTYLDSIKGFQMIVKDTKNDEDEIKKRYDEWKDSNPQYEHVAWGGSTRGYGRLQKEGQRMHLHQVPVEEIISRNSRHGRNQISIANYCIVILYQYWEDHFRNLIATSLNRNKNDIQIQLFGDIKFIRESIIHHRGIAKPEIRNCQILKWFKKGEPIDVTNDMFEEMIDKILDCLDEIEIDPNRFLVSN